jgi:hypothetical protein
VIELLAEHGKVVSEEELIAMPFRFEFSAEALRHLRDNRRGAILSGSVSGLGQRTSVVL